MSLPSAWVDRIFEKLALVYGQAVMRRWDGLDIGKVKADWAHELRGFAQSPAAIAHGLQHLPPDGPPTVLQFRQLCNAMPPPAVRALPAPQQADRARVAVEIAKLQRHRAEAQGPRDPLAWAWALKAREERDPRSLTQAQRETWRTALAPVLRRQAEELQGVHGDAGVHGGAGVTDKVPAEIEAASPAEEAAP